VELSEGDDYWELKFGEFEVKVKLWKLEASFDEMYPEYPTDFGDLYRSSDDYEVHRNIFGTYSYVDKSPEPSPSNLLVSKDDPLVLAGEITLPNNHGQPSANIVCEPWQDRLRWSVLRFIGDGLHQDIEFYWTARRPIGMRWVQFRDHRGDLIRGVIPDITIEQQATLTPMVIVDFLREAMRR
jgi:hypothetical protein